MIQKKKKGLGDRWFNPHRIARLADLSEFVGAIVSEMEKHEAAVMPRTRARRAADQDVFERQAEALLCDALLRNLTKPGEWLTASRSKTVLGRRCRYRSSVMGDKLPMVMDLLDGCGLLEVRLGDVCKYRGASIKQTTFRASKRLLERASHLDLQFSDFGTDGLEEVIVLRSEKVQGKGMLVRYEDTEETIALRSQIAALNVWLSQADIELAQDIPGVNPQDRMMHRVFNNGRFDHGGRLGGGFWQQMGKRERRDILIDGMDTIMLDFSQMGPRIIYGMAGMPFIGDAYAVPSLLKHRSLVKQVFGAMTHVGSRFNRLEDISSPLPDGMSMSRVCKAIEDHNTPIADYFYRRAGMEAMRVESNIIVDILLALRDKGVVALPVHDALVVREDLADEAEAAMLAMFKLHTGLEGLVTVE